MACFVLVRKYGPNKIKAAVYRYGAPPTIEALAALLDEDMHHEVWQTYVADASCKLVHLWSKNCKLPYYSSLTKEKRSVTDKRTGQEIVDSIVKRRRNKRRKEAEKNETV